MTAPKKPDPFGEIVTFHAADFRAALRYLADLGIPEDDVISIEMYRGATVNLGSVDAERWRRLCAFAPMQRSESPGMERWGNFTLGRVKFCAVNPRPLDVPAELPR